MKMEELGEKGLIERLKTKFERTLDPNVICGIGDDCAVIDQGDGNYQLITIDSLIENIHFIKSQINPFDLGYKTLAVNLSDIASMGGSPTYALLTLGLPQGLSVEWIDQFIEGFAHLASKFEVKLVGGNLSKSPGPIFIDLCLHGKVPKDNLKLRSNALQDDIICVTGFLGDSLAGFQILVKDNPGLTKNFSDLVAAHQRPNPHLDEGIWLGKQKSVHAMIDISDGLISDLESLQKSSNAGINIDIKNLPLSESLKKASRELGWNVQEVALKGGEDYCLLLTVDPRAYAEVSAKFKDLFHKELRAIGTVGDKGQVIKLFDNGKEVSMRVKGFDHFTINTPQDGLT